MDSEFERILQQSRLTYHQLWDDVDLEVVLEFGERYLESVPLTAERAILMAIILRLRRLGAERQLP